ncbi:MAG: hypothetical protein KA035_01960 [Candidatus Levybacteria bacterium]|nr:hypothetical protein [Candidatus Levybacteria bacterium]
MQKRKLEIRLATVLLFVFYIIFWAALFFVGWFFAADLIFYLIALIFALLTYFFVKKMSKRLAIVFTIMTILVTGFTFYSGFEEDYCTNKGEKAENMGSKFVTATNDDAKALSAFGTKESMQIGVHFRTHMLCHRTFNTLDALKDTFGL